jgi:hypothetical protein
LIYKYEENGFKTPNRKLELGEGEGEEEEQAEYKFRIESN